MISQFEMKTELECFPCFHRQIERTLAHARINGDRGRRIKRMADSVVAGANLDAVPARTSTLIHRLLNREAGTDPYRRVKDLYNDIALQKLPGLRKKAEKSSDRLEGGVRAAIAGNVIDFGIYEDVDLDGSVDEAFRLPLDGTAYAAFSKAIELARCILYLCDNAGEIVFDRILLEILKDMGKDVTVAVKGSPVINDATRDDANAAGISGVAKIIDNGNDGIGTLLEACSSEFMDAYRSADLIISKGQANFETLVPTGDKRIFFLFKVKCPVVAKALGRANGDIVLMRGTDGIRR